MMLPACFNKSAHQTLATQPVQKTGTDSSDKGYLSDRNNSDVTICQTELTKRTCHLSVSGQAAGYSAHVRKELGGKGMFLRRMQSIGLHVPPFQCVTARIINALEQLPLDTHCLSRYLPGIVTVPGSESSLTNIREHLNTLPPSEHSKKDEWLAGLAQFVASSDFYEQVKDSEVAQHIRDLRCQLDGKSTSKPVIVRSSGINEDNYGDAQAGKYLSEVQGEEDVLRTCLKVMASGYRPEVCPEGIPQPMALIIQQCIDCRYGGVAASFQSFQDDTLRVEYGPGQPRGVVAGQSGNTAHRIDIARIEGADIWEYFPGMFSSHFILRKNADNNGYLEKRIHDADVPPDGDGQRLSDDTVSELKEMVIKLENLLFCPVDVEFAIDRQGCPFVLQVRPVTRLSGGMDFAMPVPEDSLASGEAVSEGYCTGSIWLAKEQDAVAMPYGAIVVAHHAEEWMLVPEFLKRAGGFIIAEGGFNDHVAILMRQEKTPLMLAGGEYETVVAQDGQQATLACARFNGKSGAFVVAGDITEKLASHRSLSSAVSDVPLAKAVPSRDDLSPPEGTFCEVASGFQWLTDQNARLLAFFAPGGGLDCLANPIKLSMSPQRSKLLAETIDNVNRLIQGAEKLLHGYRAFLQLAIESRSSVVDQLLNELPQLICRFGTLKQTIRSVLKSIIQPMRASEEGRIFRRNFRQWIEDCYQLQCHLQALKPNTADQVRSVHELIFTLHQCFVKALAPVSLASGQGSISIKKNIIYVDCTTPGRLGEKTPLLTPSAKTSIEQSPGGGTVISMDDALIINMKLGSHVGLVELLEHAEGGKGRTLRLKFSDQFNKPNGVSKEGKLKRMWFLVQLLKVIELDKQADRMKLSCNAVAGEIIVECSRMTSLEAQQDAFEKLIIALNALYNLDLQLESIAIFEGDQWDFNLLAQRLNRSIATEADRFAFQHCLFSMFYDEKFYTYVQCHISEGCDQLISNHQRQFIDHPRRLGQSRHNLQEVFMSGEMGEDTRRELLQHLLLVHPDHAIPLFVPVYPHLEGQYYVIKPSFNARLEFNVPPGQPLPEDKEKVRNILLQNGLVYASERVRNDKDVVLPTIEAYPDDLKYVSEELKDDKKVVMAAVTQDGDQLEYASPKLQDDKNVVMIAVTQDGRNLDYASPKLQDDKDVVMAAIATYPAALRYAGENVRSDKEIVRRAIADQISCLYFASETLLNDREYMLDLIQQNSYAFNYVASGLKHDETFIEAARQKNHNVLKHVRPSANKV